MKGRKKGSERRRRRRCNKSSSEGARKGGCELLEVVAEGEAQEPEIDRDVDAREEGILDVVVVDVDVDAVVVDVVASSSSSSSSTRDFLFFAFEALFSGDVVGRKGFSVALTLPYVSISIYSDKRRKE